jgi:hypothetical protein
MTQEVVTLSVKPRGSISSALGVRVTREMDSISLTFKHWRHDHFSARFGVNQQSLCWPGLDGSQGETMKAEEGAV